MLALANCCDIWGIKQLRTSCYLKIINLMVQWNLWWCTSAASHHPAFHCFPIPTWYQGFYLLQNTFSIIFCDRLSFLRMSAENFSKSVWITLCSFSSKYKRLAATICYMIGVIWMLSLALFFHSLVSQASDTYTENTDRLKGQKNTIHSSRFTLSSVPANSITGRDREKRQKQNKKKKTGADNFKKTR